MGNAFATVIPPDAVTRIESKNEWISKFESLKKSSKLMVVDFAALWAGPSLYMEPIFGSLSKKYEDVVFVRIDGDELVDVAREFGVDAMPTFLFFKNGKEIDRLVGANKDELKEKIIRHRAH